MIRKFRHKIQMILVSIFAIAMAGILFAVNLTYYKSNHYEIEKLLSSQMNFLEEREVPQEAADSTISDSDTAEKPDSVTYQLTPIYIVSKQDGELSLERSADDSSDMEKEQIFAVAEDILANKDQDGRMNHFQYEVFNYGDKIVVAFMDVRFLDYQQRNMIILSGIIGLAALLVWIGVSFFMSRWLVRPLEEAFQKQREFISFAGHELKTPLTVMKASLEMMQQQPEEKYLHYMMEENEKMTNLVHELLTLSKLERQRENPELMQVNLARIVEGAALPFEVIAYEKNLDFSMNIPDGINEMSGGAETDKIDDLDETDSRDGTDNIDETDNRDGTGNRDKVEEAWRILGNEQQLQQLVGILIDNAIKHTKEPNQVRVQLRRDNAKAVLEVENQGEAIPMEERQKIFEQFYRGDRSRNRQEGRYGLGLSIAQNIASIHHTKIQVNCENGWTSFSIKFELCKK